MSQSLQKECYMKAQFWHAERFGFDVESPSERINGTRPENVDDGNRSVLVEDCLVALFHLEENDGELQIRRLHKDIRRIAQKVGARRLVVAAFGHLSHSYAPATVAITISQHIVAECRTWEDFEVYTSPFGHNKTFNLSAKGHPDAVKFRSY